MPARNIHYRLWNFLLQCINRKKERERKGKRRAFFYLRSVGLCVDACEALGREMATGYWLPQQAAKTLKSRDEVQVERWQSCRYNKANLSVHTI